MGNMSVSSLRDVRISRREARREELLDAADRAIRRQGPAVSMDEIAAEAGVTKPILYRHFGDKAGLSLALGERYVAALLARIHEALEREKDPRRRLETTLDVYLALVDEDTQVYRFIVQETIAEVASSIAVSADGGAAGSSFIRRIAGEVAQILREEASRFGVESAPAEEWAHAIVGMMHLAGDWWLERRHMPRQQLVESLTSLLWGGLSSMAQPG
jgi:AcrR family transcriptional regulator